MPNYFDQFDEAGPATAEAPSGNFFDQFDEVAEAPPLTDIDPFSPDQQNLRRVMQNFPNERAQRVWDQPTVSNEELIKRQTWKDLSAADKLAVDAIRLERGFKTTAAALPKGFAVHSAGQNPYNPPDVMGLGAPVTAQNEALSQEWEDKRAAMTGEQKQAELEASAMWQLGKSIEKTIPDSPQPSNVNRPLASAFEGAGSLGASMSMAPLGVAPMMSGMFLMELSDAYESEIARQQDTGEPLNPGKASAKASLYAAGAIPLEYIGGAGRLARRWFGTAAENEVRELARKGGGEAVLAFFSERAKDAALEGGTESLQRLWQDAIVHGKPNIAAALQEGASAAGGSLLLGGVAQGTRLAGHKAGQAFSEARSNENIDQALQESGQQIALEQSFPPGFAPPIDPAETRGNVFDIFDEVASESQSPQETAQASSGLVTKVTPAAAAATPAPAGASDNVVGQTLVQDAPPQGQQQSQVRAELQALPGADQDLMRQAPTLTPEQTDAGLRESPADDNAPATKADLAALANFIQNGGNNPFAAKPTDLKGGVSSEQTQRQGQEVLNTPAAPTGAAVQPSNAVNVEVLPKVPDTITVRTPKGNRIVRIGARHVDMNTANPVEMTKITLFDPTTGAKEVFPVPSGRKFATLDEAGQVGFDLVRAKFPEVEGLPKPEAETIDPAQKTTQVVNRPTFAVGQKVAVRLSNRSNKEHLARITQLQPDGSAQVQVEGEKTFRMVAANQLMLTKTDRARRAKQEELATVPAEQQEQVKADAAEFAQVVEDYAPQLEWAPGEAYDRNTAMQEQGVENARLRNAAIERAMRTVLPEGQWNSVVDRARALPKLVEYLTQQFPGDNSIAKRRALEDFSTSETEASPALEQQQAIVDRLAASNPGLPELKGLRAVGVRNAGAKVQLRPGHSTGTGGKPGLPSAATAEIAQLLERLYDLNIIFVDSAGALPFNGVKFVGTKTVLIHVRTGKPMLTVAGHELLHHIKETHPGLYAELVAAVGEMDVEGYRARLTDPAYAGKSDAQITEELLGDFLGDSLADPAFLKSLAQQEPNLFKRFARIAISWLEKLIAKLKGVGFSRYNVSQHIADIEAARESLRTMLVEAAKATQYRKAGISEESGSNQESDENPFSKDRPFHASNATIYPPGVKFSITAHHGTPHKVDKFSTAKIGTGEGAQVYGWGLYFAENAEVGKQYRKNLAGEGVRIDERKIEVSDGLVRAYAAKRIADSGSYDNALMALKWEIKDAEKWGHSTKNLQDQLAEMESLKGLKIDYGPGGNEYTVSLNVEDEDLLDWDKPLSEQSEKVKKAVADRNEDLENQRTMPGNAKRSEPNGADVYRTLQERRRDDRPEYTYADPKAASEYLASLGIKGIRYLDQGSRPTPNVDYVTRRIKIVEAELEKWIDPDATRFHTAETIQNMRSNTQSELNALRKTLFEAKNAPPPTYNYVIFSGDDITITHENGKEVSAGVLFSKERGDDMFSFDAPESVSDQKSRLAAEKRKADEAKAKASMQERAGAKLTGSDVDTTKEMFGAEVRQDKSGQGALFSKERKQTGSKRERNAANYIRNLLWEAGELEAEYNDALKTLPPKSYSLPDIEAALFRNGEKRDWNEIVRDEGDTAHGFNVKATPFEWAKQNHGTTDDINVAGYVLPSGEMLDFSERRHGGGGDRSLDHRNIQYEGRPSDGYEAMRQFIGMGGVRVDKSGAVDIGKMPTSSQISRLRELGESAGSLTVDLLDGKRKASFTTENIERGLGMIRRFYNGEELPEHQALFSKERNDNPFYSRLTRAVELSQQGKASGAQWKATIRNSKIGSSTDEFALVGVNDLEDGKTYTKQEVLDYLKANEIQVNDVTLGSLSDADEARLTELFDAEQAGTLTDAEFAEQEHLQDAVKRHETHFSTYQLPGAKEGSYREVLLTVPDVPNARKFEPSKVDVRQTTRSVTQGSTSIWYDGKRLADYGDDPRLQSDGSYKQRSKDYWIGIAKDLFEKGDERNSIGQLGNGWKDGHSQYSDIANPIVRLRFNERTTADGKRMLFLEEVQAPQKGQFEKMPALFQKNWREIAFKWALRHAAENGFDAVGWTRGEQQAERYDLSKQVEKIRWGKSLSGSQNAIEGKTKWVVVSPYSSDPIHLFADNAGIVNQAKVGGRHDSTFVGKSLADIVGKEVGTKIVSEAEGDLSGEGLKIGGEGLKKLYDVDFRNVVNNLSAVKKAGQKAGTAEVGVGDKPSFIISDEQSPSAAKVRMRLQAIQKIWDGPGRTAAGWNNWNVSLNKQAEQVLRNMEFNDKSYRESMDAYGSIQLADKLALGGEWQASPLKDTIHSIDITPAIRESVMGGQALFSKARQEESTSPTDGPFRQLQDKITKAEAELMAAIRQHIKPPEGMTKATALSAKNAAVSKLNRLLAEQLKQMTSATVDAARSPEQTAELIAQTVSLLNHAQDEIATHTARSEAIPAGLTQLRQDLQTRLNVLKGWTEDQTDLAANGQPAPRSAPKGRDLRKRNLESATDGGRKGIGDFWNSLKAGLRYLTSPIPELPLTGERAEKSALFRRGYRLFAVENNAVRKEAAEKINRVLEPLTKLGRKGADNAVLQQFFQLGNARQRAAMNPAQLAKIDARMAALEAELNKDPFDLFRRLVLYRDLWWRGTYLKNEQGKPITLPQGLIVEDVADELRKLTSLIADHKDGLAITEALRRHYALTDELQKSILAHGEIIPESLRNPLYFPHHVIDHWTGNFARVRATTEEDFRKYLIAPVGSGALIQTDYLKAMMLHTADVLAHNARIDLVQKYWQPYDISEQLKKQHGSSTWNKPWNIPPGYKVFTPYKKLPLRMDYILSREVLADKLGVLFNDGDLRERLGESGLVLKVKPEDLHAALVAGEKIQWVLPSEITDALNGIARREAAAANPGLGHSLGLPFRALNNFWKKTTLFAPWNWVRYEYGNLSTDAIDKVLAADPAVAKHMARAARELWESGLAPEPPGGAGILGRVRRQLDAVSRRIGYGELTPEFKAAQREGVFETITAGEAGELAKLPQFKAFLTTGEARWDNVRTVLAAPMRGSKFREGVFRYAKFLADVERLRAGKEPVYAGAFHGDIEALGEDVDGQRRLLDGDELIFAKAAEISLKTYGDYQSLGVVGQWLRQYAIPFWSWQDVNFRYHANQLRNIADGIKGVPGGTERTAALRYAGIRVVSTLLAVGIAKELWNQFGGVAMGLWDEDDDLESKLSEADRRRGHLLLGKDANGQVKVVYTPSAWSDVVEWTGGQNMKRLFMEYVRGQITLNQFIRDYAKQLPMDVGNKAAQSGGPLLKAPYELASGRATFPDVFDQRNIPEADKWWRFVGGLTDQRVVGTLRAAFDQDYYSQPATEQLQQIILQIRRRDPEQWAYYEAREDASDWKEAKTGKRFEHGSYNAPEALALRNFRKSIYRGDVANAERFYNRLIQFGYTAERLDASIRNQHPLSNLTTAERSEYAKTLTTRQKEELELASKYYSRLKALDHREKFLFKSKQVPNRDPNPALLRQIVEDQSRNK